MRKQKPWLMHLSQFFSFLWKIITSWNKWIGILEKFNSWWNVVSFMKCLITMQKGRADVDLFITSIQQWRYGRVNSLSILATVFSCSSKLHIKIMLMFEKYYNYLKIKQIYSKRRFCSTLIGGHKITSKNISYKDQCCI